MIIRLHFLSIVILCSAYFICTESFCAPTPKKSIKVVVTGAGTSVGFFVFKKLLKYKSIYPVGLVTDNSAAKKLYDLGANSGQVFIGDIRDKESLLEPFKDVDKAILCTSARPRLSLQFRIKSLFLKLLKRPCKATTEDKYYSKGEEPYMIDYIGQKNVIDVAVQNNVNHIVMLGNMGGYRGSKLNDIGKIKDDPKSGNLLKWKRAAERYLMKRSFFTIIHAAMLTDEPGGEREIIWDIDDSLLRTNFRKISREDVAEVLTQALIWKESIGRSIDVATRPRGKATTTTQDWLRFWSRPGNCLYPVDDFFDDSIV